MSHPSEMYKMQIKVLYFCCKKEMSIGKQQQNRVLKFPHETECQAHWAEPAGASDEDELGFEGRSTVLRQKVSPGLVLGKGRGHSGSPRLPLWPRRAGVGRLQSEFSFHPVQQCGQPPL